jgi:hypothetical protein
MLKSPVSMKFEIQAANALRGLLEQVPVIERLDIQPVESPGGDVGVDIVVHASVLGKRHTLLCQVKSNGQPRHVRMALLELGNATAHRAQKTTPILIAPYLSPDGQALCREHGVGFLDLEGNARLAFGSVFIDRQVATRPISERRELRSLFKPRSAQVLRVMLRDPQRAWRVIDLAAASGVSLGHVSNVRNGLLKREWAHVAGDGLVLSEPDTLLDEWCEAYEPPVGKRLSFYTVLHGNALDEGFRRVAPAHPSSELVALASFSAAQWLAPYGRTGSHYIYADEAGLEHLKAALKLSSVAKGGTVEVTLLEDPGLFRDTVEPAPGIICTSPVQTYLDLAAAGERGREAADHLRQEKLKWHE